MRPWPASLVLALALATAGPARAEEPARLYRDHCAACHGPDRLGAMGPALLPESLDRLDPSAVARAIAAGREATTMPGFGEVLAPAEIEALAAFLRTPVTPAPAWGAAEIRASRTELVDPAALPSAPVHGADPLDLFVVVEAGDHHLTVLDGDRLEPIARFPTRFALHGGPKFSPDGRFVYLASRDGWISKVDLYGLRVVAEVRAGLNTRNLAVSGDGRTVMVANTLPRTLVALDAELRLQAVIPIADRFGKETSRASAVYQAAPRGSFVVALKDLPELWEIPYASDAPAATGFVHSYEAGMEESVATTGRWPIRRIELEAPLDDFFFTPDYRALVGTTRGGGAAQVVNLNVGRVIATIPMGGLPHLGSGMSWVRDGRPVMATTNLREGKVTVIDMTTWTVVREIPTAGPGFFLRGHEALDEAWVDASLGPTPDVIQVIDETSLKVVRTLRPSPGKVANHVEFTNDGRFALVSVADADGALVVYDTATHMEVKRLPMNKPVGKYNVGNKIGLSPGTSH
jgi:mono/diheme cytochrome c family protein/DNA-binding beta-propeller fold protein YncE